jgi:hypothetical protein
MTDDEMDIPIEGFSHIDTWDENGKNRSWNIPNTFEPDLPFWERLAKWRDAHPELENLSDMDHAFELCRKFTESSDEG